MSSVPIRSNRSFLGWTSITEAHDGEGHTLRFLQIVNHSIKHHKPLGLGPWGFEKNRQMQLNIQASERSARHPRFPSYTSKTSLQFHPLPDLESWLWTFSGRYGKPISCYKSPSRPSEATTSVEVNRLEKMVSFFSKVGLKVQSFRGNFCPKMGYVQRSWGHNYQSLLGLLENFPTWSDTSSFTQKDSAGITHPQIVGVTDPMNKMDLLRAQESRFRIHPLNRSIELDFFETCPAWILAHLSHCHFPWFDRALTL